MTTDDIKQKYAAAFSILHNEGGQITKEVDGNPAYIQANVPSLATKNKIWDAVKKKDPSYKDMTLDIVILVAEEKKAAGGASGASGTYSRWSGSSGATGVASEAIGTPPCTYTVKKGDTLSRIAQLFYGDSTEYMKIFEANLDVLNDPNMIKPGQVLTIPK